MVTVSSFQEREGKDGKPYFTLTLTGDLEIVFSKATSRPYATARTTTIPATFPAEVCQSLIGKTLPGTIKKIECEEYEYTLPESDQKVQLKHRWQYVREEEDEVAVFSIPSKKNTFSKSGK